MILSGRGWGRVAVRFMAMTRMSVDITRARRRRLALMHADVEAGCMLSEDWCHVP